jgi:two-component system, OmpR family, heavy metal sensor histidine kinase CusS
VPSLRRSLILYFLILLVLGLGVAALVADQAVFSARSERVAATVKLIERGADDRIKEANDKFDQELLASARLVSRTATLDYKNRLDQANRELYAMVPMFVMSQQLKSHPSMTLPAITAEIAFHQPVNRRNSPPLRGPLWDAMLGPVAQSIFTPLNIGTYLESELNDVDHVDDFIQLNTSRKTLFKSTKLGTAGLPFNMTEWENDPNATMKYDNVELPNGPGRRIILKEKSQFNAAWWLTGQQPIRLPFSPPPPPPEGGRGPGGGGPGGPGGPGGGRDRDPNQQPRGNDFGSIQYFYHVARPIAPHEARLDLIRDEATVQIAQVREDNAVAQRAFRWTVALTALVLMIGLPLGGWFMMGISLKPLSKLSDAVSRVNEKDFRLPMERAELTSELLPIHDRLAQSLEALKLAFEREKEAVADISHELRTPVAGLMATLDVSLRKTRTAEQYRTTLEECRGITKQLSDLVERVMTLAYLDAGHVKATVTSTDVPKLAKECADLIRPLAEAQNVTLETNFADVEQINTDAGKLREIALNLLHNAVEYNQPGGTIRLSVRSSLEDQVILEVADTGIGMTAEVKKKIFERFYRADPSRTATGVHAGLGLAIVKEYVKQLGGTITVDSEPGTGSTFRVTLPHTA